MCMAVDGQLHICPFGTNTIPNKSPNGKEKLKKERKTSCPLGILRVLVVGIGIHSFFYKNIEAEICEILGIF